jgi:hypothetical protein
LNQASGLYKFHVLADLVDAYKRTHHPIPDRSGPRMLRQLLENRGMSMAKAAQEIGMAPSTIFETLAASAESDATTSTRLSATSPCSQQCYCPIRGRAGVDAEYDALPIVLVPAMISSSNGAL